MSITPSIREKASVIYAFENIANGKMLIGYTTNLIGRIYKYISDTNNPEFSSDFYTDLRAHPESFTFRILKKIPKSRNALLPTLEVEYIAKYNSFENGYNQNKGGGGSRSQYTSSGNASPDRTQILKTPTKSYPFIKVDGKIKVLTSPGLRATEKVIYTIFDTKKTKIGETRHYIGLTGQKVSKRVSQHLSKFNSTKRRSKETKLVRKLRANPTRYRFGMLLQLEPNESLRKAEIFAIKQKKATVIGLNHNKGGGGGCSQ